jgi:hypothetical protein
MGLCCKWFGLKGWYLAGNARSLQRIATKSQFRPGEDEMNNTRALSGYACILNHLRKLFRLISPSPGGKGGTHPPYPWRFILLLLAFNVV